MTFRRRGRNPEPTEEIRALVSLLLPDIDVWSSSPNGDGEPTRWSISYRDRYRHLPVEASLEEWQKMLTGIVSGNY